VIRLTGPTPARSAADGEAPASAPRIAGSAESGYPDGTAAANGSASRSGTSTRCSCTCRSVDQPSPLARYLVVVIRRAGSAADGTPSTLP
jgi:hypothetical protein